jgi:hypothetical protein
MTIYSKRILALISLVFGAQLALAEAPKPAKAAAPKGSVSGVHLLTYEEFMALNPKQRPKYILGLRKIIIELNSFDPYFFAGTTIENRPQYSAAASWLELLNASLTSADAQGLDVDPSEVQARDKKNAERQNEKALSEYNRIKSAREQVLNDIKSTQESSIRDITATQAKHTASAVRVYNERNGKALFGQKKLGDHDFNANYIGSKYESDKDLKKALRDPSRIKIIKNSNGDEDPELSECVDGHSQFYPSPGQTAFKGMKLCLNATEASAANKHGINPLGLAGKGAANELAVIQATADKKLAVANKLAAEKLATLASLPKLQEPVGEPSKLEPSKVDDAQSASARAERLEKIAESKKALEALTGLQPKKSENFSRPPVRNESASNQPVATTQQAAPPAAAIPAGPSGGSPAVVGVADDEGVSAPASAATAAPTGATAGTSGTTNGAQAAAKCDPLDEDCIEGKTPAAVATQQAASAPLDVKKDDEAAAAIANQCVALEPPSLKTYRDFVKKGMAASRKEGTPEKQRQKRPNCVFGGFIAKYSDSNPGYCEPAPRVSVRLADGSNRALSCGPATINGKLAPQTLCHPLLFGTGDEGKGLCVSDKKNATKACDAKSSGSAKPASDFWKELGPVIAKSEWESFTKSFEDLCKPEASSQKYFCVECSLMKTRLDQLNAEVSKAPVEPAKPKQIVAIVPPVARVPAPSAKKPSVPSAPKGALDEEEDASFVVGEVPAQKASPAKKIGK